MKVHCPSCGTQIPAADLNLQTLLARCRKCDSIFSFADDGRTIRLVGGLKENDEAHFLQRQLERHLNVRPSPIGQ